MRLGTCLGLFTSTLVCAAFLGCSSESGRDDGGGGSNGTGSTHGSGSTNGTGSVSGVGGINVGSDTGSGGSGDESNPASCDQAKTARSYIGCDFWPTVTYNKVHEGFEFAVVLANGGNEDAEVEVTGGALSAPIMDVVPAHGLKAILLPWVPGLKGPIWANANTSGGRDAATTTRVNGGAYHVKTLKPVTAWQFSPLDYKKSGVSPCYTSFGQADCFSVSNDASLLVPSTAMTGDYRVFSYNGDNGGDWGSMAGGFAITATEDGTSVTVQFGPKCEHENNGNPGTCTIGVDGQPKAPGSTETFTLNAGDVVEYVGTLGANSGLKNADVSGSIVQADKSVQVIAFNPLVNVPDSAQGHGNADHVEELVLPGQVIGKDYIIAPPTATSGVVHGGHIVRLIGNVDGTTLTYENQPAGAPTSINAGDIVELPTTTSFRVTGTQPFAAISVTYGGWKQGTEAGCSAGDIQFPCSGDPDITQEVTPEQFRKQYTFLAPTNYDKNYADILVPDGATVTLDGAALTTVGEPVVTGWTIHRVPLTGGDGSHRLESDMPVGLQVMGYGHATSYSYPGGLNLKIISDPPIIK